VVDHEHPAPILWQGFILPGHEACRLFRKDTRWHLEGTAVFSHEGQPGRLHYEVLCDAGWHTLSARVEGWLGSTPVQVEIRTDAGHRWWMNEVEQPAVEGCIDLDLNFSPSTNALPIRRLGLGPGEAADVRAAWLRFPTFTLEPLPQRYHRLGETTYRYESSGGRFAVDLEVNADGLVLEYPGVWKAEPEAEP